MSEIANLSVKCLEERWTNNKFLITFSFVYWVYLFSLHFGIYLNIYCYFNQVVVYTNILLFDYFCDPVTSLLGFLFIQQYILKRKIYTRLNQQICKQTSSTSHCDENLFATHARDEYKTFKNVLLYSLTWESPVDLTKFSVSFNNWVPLMKSLFSQ